MKKISEKVFTETAYHGCNCSAVVTDEGLVLIDSPYLPSDALRWRGELKDLGRVKYIISTEHHTDHVLGNGFFEGVGISHDVTRENFGAGPQMMEDLVARVRDLDPAGLPHMDNYKPKEPAITFDHHLTLHSGDVQFQLTLLPGHTPNEIAVYLPGERVVFTGDNVVFRTRPFYHECKPREWMETLDALKHMDFDVLVPGHGEVCDKGAIDELLSYHEEVFGQVQRAIEEGLSKEETLKKVVFDDRMPLQEYQKAKYGPKLEQMGITRLYEEFAKRDLQ